jgi:enoyl-CoA hydratase
MDSGYAGQMDDVAILRVQGGKANAMSVELLESIVRLVDDFAAGPARAAVITGYERFFSAGLALPALIDLDRASMRRFIGRFDEIMLRIFSCEKPIVAAINGHAIAGGCVLALQCDWRVMIDDEAKIGLNETQLGIGLPATVLEPLRLQVPPSSLLAVAYEGRIVTPAEALELGLVHELAPARDLEPRALVRARALAAVPAAAVAQVKLGLRRGAIEAMRRNAADEAERWLDTWFSTAAQERLGRAVAQLKR